jgi:hypothetical protein
MRDIGQRELNNSSFAITTFSIKKDCIQKRSTRQNADDSQLSNVEFLGPVLILYYVTIFTLGDVYLHIFFISLDSEFRFRAGRGAGDKARWSRRKGATVVPTQRGSNQR